MEFTSPRAEAASDQATPERLAILADDADVGVQRAAAKNLHTPPVALERLSHSSDRAVRRSVALNPNTPKDLLLRLATQFPGDFFRNPAFDWLLLEDPDLVINLGQGVLKNILKRPDCPGSFMKWAAERGNEQEKLAVAMNASAAENLLRALIDQGGLPGESAQGHERVKCDATLADAERVFLDAVRSSLAELSVTDAKALWRRGCIGPAQWLALSLRVKTAVPGRDGWSVPFPVADQAREEAGAQIDVTTLATKRSTLERVDLAFSPFTSPHALAILAQDTAVDVRKKVAGNQATPVSSLHRLVDDAEQSVRSSLALNRAAPLECLSRLASDNEEVVRRAVASNKSTPKTELQALAFDPARQVVKCVAGNPATPNKVLEALALDQSVDIRSVVADNPSTPAAALQRLALDQDVDIRSAVASNPSTPPATLQVLALDDTKNWRGLVVRQAVAKNPHTDYKMLEALALDQDVEVRAAVAGNRAAPYALLERLSTDDESTRDGPIVRLAVARNSSTQPAVLQALALDITKHWARGAVVRQAVAGNPNTPDSVLSGLSRDTDKLVLVAVARNPATTKEALEALVTDKNMNVRAALAENPKTPLAALQRLARIKDSKVMAGLAKNPECPSHLHCLSAALRWRHDLVKLAKSFPNDADGRLPSLPQDESICEIFRNECQLLLSSPRESIVAKMICADTQQDVLELEGEHTRSAARSSVRAVRLRGLRHWKADPVVLVKTYRSTDWVERLAIAGNQGAPLNVIEALAKDPHRLVALCAQATAQVKAEEIKLQADALADESLHFDCVQLANEVSNRLQSLEDERGTQHLCDTPWWDFLTPFQRYCSAELNQSPYTLTAPPSLPHSLQIRLLEALARERPSAVAAGCSKLTSEVLMDLAKHADVDVRRCVAESQFTPIDAFELLSKDKKDLVRFTVAENPAAPVEVLRRLANLKDEFIRHSVACNTSTPLEVLKKLAIDTDPFVRKGVAENAAAPLSLRRDLLDQLSLETEDSTQLWVFLNPLTETHVRESLITKLMKSENSHFRKELASSPIISQDLLEQLGSDADEGVREAVGANPNSPATILRILAKESSKDIRKAVAAHPATPAVVLECLASDSDIVVLDAITSNPVTPKPVRDALLEKLACSTDIFIRVKVASNENTPRALLRQLSLDSNIRVQQAIAGNPSTPPKAIEMLMQHTHLHILLLNNPTTTTELQCRLIALMSVSEHPGIRKAIAKSTLVPVDFLENLSNDDDVWVRNAVAQNPSTPGAVLVMLARSGFWALRFSAIGNPSFPRDCRETALTTLTAEIENALTPAAPISADRFSPEDFVTALEELGLMPDELDRKTISKAAKSKDWLQRAAVTLCQGVLPGELRRLMDDEVEAVKLLAILRLKQLHVAKATVGQVLTVAFFDNLGIPRLT